MRPSRDGHSPDPGCTPSTLSTGSHLGTELIHTIIRHHSCLAPRQHPNTSPSRIPGAPSPLRSQSSSVEYLLSTSTSHDEVQLQPSLAGRHHLMLLSRQDPPPNANPTFNSCQASFKSGNHNIRLRRFSGGGFEVSRWISEHPPPSENREDDEALCMPGQLPGLELVDGRYLLARHQNVSAMAFTSNARWYVGVSGWRVMTKGSAGEHGISGPCCSSVRDDECTTPLTCECGILTSAVSVLGAQTPVRNHEISISSIRAAGSRSPASAGWSKRRIPVSCMFVTDVLQTDQGEYRVEQPQYASQTEARDLFLRS